MQAAVSGMRKSSETLKVFASRVTRFRTRTFHSVSWTSSSCSLPLRGSMRGAVPVARGSALVVIPVQCDDSRIRVQGVFCFFARAFTGHSSDTFSKVSSRRDFRLRSMSGNCNEIRHRSDRYKSNRARCKKIRGDVKPRARRSSQCDFSHDKSHRSTI